MGCLVCVFVRACALVISLTLVLPGIFALVTNEPFLPLDEPCGEAIDWWVSQPLFSFLDGDRTMPAGTAFSLSWQQYRDIVSRAAGARAAKLHGGAPPGAGRKKTARASDTPQRFWPVNGFEQRGFVEHHLLGQEGAQLRIFSEADRQLVLGDWLYLRVYDHTVIDGRGEPGGVRQFRWKKFHKHFCFEILENLLWLMMRYLDAANSVLSAIQADLVQRRVLDLDVGELLRTTERHLLLLLKMASFRLEEVRGVRPEMLKPVLATLSYIARKTRNMRLQACVRDVAEGSKRSWEEESHDTRWLLAQTAIAIGEKSDFLHHEPVGLSRLSRRLGPLAAHQLNNRVAGFSTMELANNKVRTSFETCHGDSDVSDAVLARCCRALGILEGPALADAWRARVRNEALDRDVRHSALYYARRQRGWIDPAFHRAEDFSLLNITTVLRNLFAPYDLDLVLLDYLEADDVAGAFNLLADDLHLSATGTAPVPMSQGRAAALGSLFVQTSTSSEVASRTDAGAASELAFRRTELHLPVLAGYLESPLFPALEEEVLPSLMTQIPLSRHETVEGGRALPAFHILKRRDLIADSVRRHHALDCPLASLLEESRVDIFVEVGGFFGDCVLAATVAGWARYGVVELDGSRPAIKALNRTMHLLFLPTRERIRDFPAAYFAIEPGRDPDAGALGPGLARVVRGAEHSSFWEEESPGGSGRDEREWGFGESDAPPPGAYLFHVAAVFVSNVTGWFAPRRPERENMASEVFHGGANAFSGVEWAPCAAGGTPVVISPNRTSVDQEAPAEGTMTTTRGGPACTRFETIDNVVLGELLPTFLRLQGRRFISTAAELQLLNRSSLLDAQASPPAELQAPDAANWALSPLYLEDLLGRENERPRHVNLGLRIKVSGTEHLVLRGAGRALRYASWVHITVMPDCFCEKEVLELLEDAETNMVVVEKERNPYNEVVVVARKRREGGG